MRINKLKFSNLNSLKGEFEIDFTDNSIVEDNIFAIIGNTGSGKSTILDAITLALFGQTSRIGKVTKSRNEIMNRECGSCYSEVIFTTSNKEYSALFSQRRAHSKKDGNLVSSIKELRDYSENKLIASNKTFDAELMNLINLTFDQFSRSVLLAQGDFNKFLIAKDDDKAKILEQITGTEIYSKIGMKIYEHHSFEKKKLEILDAQLESQNILAEDEKKSIECNIAINSTKILELNKLKQDNANDLVYYSVKSNLDKKRITLRSDKNILDAKTSTYNNYLNKIELNSKAQKPLELLHKIKVDTNSQNTIQNDIEKLDEELFAINEKINLLTTDKTNCKVELKIHEDEKSKTIEIIKKVRPLDKAINDLSIKGENLLDKISELKLTLKNLNKEYSLLNLKINDSQLLITKSNEYLLSHKNDKPLVDNFTEIVSNNNLFQTTTTQKESLFDEIETSNLALESELKLQKELTKNLVDTDNSIDKNKSTLSSDKTKEELEDELETLNKREKTLDRTSITLDTYLDDTRILSFKTSEFKNKNTQYNDCIKKLEETSLLYETSRIALERGKELLKLSAFACEVKDDVPCPLCGSLVHPLPLFVEKNQLQNEEFNVQSLKSSLEICNSEKTSLNSEIQVLKARITQLESSILKGSTLLSKILDQNESFETAFKLNKSQNNNSLISVKSQIKNLENIEKKISILLRDRATYSERLSNNKKNTFKLIELLKVLKKKSTSTDDTLKSINNFFEEFNTFKSRANNELKEIKNKYSYHLNMVDNKINELDNFKSQEVKNSAAIEDKKQTIKDAEENLLISISSLDKLKGNRFSIFEKKDCDDELNSINESIKKTNNNVLAFTNQLSEYVRLKSIRITTLKFNQDNYKTLSASLIDDRNNFDIILANNNFSNEMSLLSALLDANDIINYEIFIKEYESLCERIKTIKDDINKDEHSLNKNKPEKDLDDCLDDKIELDNKYDLLQQSKGNLQEKLDTDKKNVSRMGKIKEDREKQYIKSDNWAKLNAAVGSSDGKKFRGLAQGITLDFLLNNSNNKLSNLTDRYALVRSNTQTGSTLDIDVIDLYMNGITRSVNNLSGGEKFLVSLSLALGLCELVNSDNPSETLFLDEGFGSLDEDTLDNALSTLMILSESENKLIGIISHVQKVKDAIAHKIVVEKNGNGSSSITGPGVIQL